MRFTVRRIDLGSVARLGCLIGWLVALIPALCSAWLAVAVLQRVYEAFLQVKPFDVNLLGRDVLRIDFLDALRLTPVKATIQPWVENPVQTLAALTLVLMLAGGVLWMLTWLLAGGMYNLIAALGGGITVDLVERREVRSGGRRLHTGDQPEKAGNLPLKDA